MIRSRLHVVKDARACDVQTVLTKAERSLDTAVRWWWSELRALGQPPGAVAASGSENIIVQLGQDATRVVPRQGEAIVLAPFVDLDDTDRDTLADTLTEAQATILLDPIGVHQFTIELPRMARRRLRELVLLQLASRSPIDPALVETTIVNLRPTRPRFVQVDVAIVRRQDIGSVADRWRALNLSPAAIGINDPARGTVTILRKPGIAVSAPLSHGSIAGIALALIMIASITPIALTSAFDRVSRPMRAETGTLRRSLVPRMTAAAQLPRLRRLNQVAASEPPGFDALDTLAGLARTLPVGTWARSVEIGPRQVTLALETKNVDASLASLIGASVLWRNPRRLGVAPGGGVLVTLDRGR